MNFYKSYPVECLYDLKCPKCKHHLRNCIDALTGGFGNVYFCHECPKWWFFHMKEDKK